MIACPKYSVCIGGWDPNEHWGGGGMVGSVFGGMRKGTPLLDYFSTFIGYPWHTHGTLRHTKGQLTRKHQNT